MYDPRYSPAYQIPYQPLYETARLQIERSIFTLEEKFRRRREIDKELSARPILPFPPVELEHNYYEKVPSIEQEERILINMEKQANYQRQLAAQAQHLNRIQLLKKERDILQLQSSYKRDLLEVPYPKIYKHDDNADDEELIKKYQNGSKAKQYYKDLELQNQRKNEDNQAYKRQNAKRQNQKQLRQDKHRLDKLEKRLFDEKANGQSETKNHHKSQGIYSDRKELNHKRQIYDTPYDILRPPQTTVNKEQFKRSPLAQQLEKQFEKIDVQKDHLSSKMAYTMKQRSSSPLKLLESSKVNQKAASPYKGMNKYQSMGKFAPYRSKSALSPLKKSYNDSYLQSKRTKQADQPKPSMKEIEIDALKKIENRLKVSKVIYEDSQFRNIKYQGNHLYNTFEIESRQRRQIKDKVNGHPYVLKKHALVVD